MVKQPVNEPKKAPWRLRVLLLGLALLAMFVVGGALWEREAAAPAVPSVKPATRLVAGRTSPLQGRRLTPSSGDVQVIVPSVSARRDDWPPSHYFPRDPEEWQGMPVDLNFNPPCHTSADCAFALACRDNHCGPCLSDEQCAIGEVCVLDQCLRRDNVTCRSRRDCPSGEKCMLTAYSPQLRNNQDLRSKCTQTLHPVFEPRPSNPVVPIPTTAPVHPDMQPSDLVKMLEDAETHPE
jgi:hypothetical protein